MTFVSMHCCPSNGPTVRLAVLLRSPVRPLIESQNNNNGCPLFIFPFAGRSTFRFRCLTLVASLSIPHRLIDSGWVPLQTFRYIVDIARTHIGPTFCSSGKRQKAKNFVTLHCFYFIMPRRRALSKDHQVPFFKTHISNQKVCACVRIIYENFRWFFGCIPTE